MKQKNFSQILDVAATLYNGKCEYNFSSFAATGIDDEHWLDTLLLWWILCGFLPDLNSSFSIVKEPGSSKCLSSV